MSKQPEYFYWKSVESPREAYAAYVMKDTDYTATVKFDGSFSISGYDNSTSLEIEENRLSADLDWLIDALTELREISKEFTSTL